MFELQPALQRDCILLGRFPLSLLLLMNDSRYPWLILVPQRPGLTELFQLSPDDRRQLLDESCILAAALAKSYRPDKLNIATIGNLVPQLHLHHVVRYRTDDAWPAPVWGKLPARPYRAAEVTTIRERIAAMELERYLPQS
jgi:diadenosine tetraphosphate (Ap4A) HIT family hydrolase